MTEKKRIYVKTRQATAEDAVRILNLLQIQHIRERQDFPEWNSMDALQWIINTLQNGYVNVVEADGELLGSIGVTTTVCPWNKSVGHGYVQWIYALPEYESKGVGKRMLADAIKIANKHGFDIYTYLESDDADKRMDALLENEGLKQMGRLMVWRAKKESETPMRVNL